jgi:tRNA pseudouridine38-40 synthase
LQRYRALVEYDGSAYYGFQRQQDEQPTIQAELEKVLNHLAQRPVPVTGAGRTDSGVHALGQVISFTMEWHHGWEALQRAINANLPVDIAVLKVEEVSSAFHPRFAARRRGYMYHICNTTVRSPLQRLRSWHISQPLDVEKMNQAAKRLLGVHDFATFGQPPHGENTVREVFVANWRRQDKLLIFTIEANAFLYRMVRSVVGSLKLVGDDTWSVEDFVAALQACNRSRAGTVAPPQGLYLVSVTYEDNADRD